MSGNDSAHNILEESRAIHPAPPPSALPMPVAVTPYLHQQRAFAFACQRFGLTGGPVESCGVALLMEMGCGKTLTAIGIAGELFLQGRIQRVLVTAPLSVLGVWEDEFRKFAAFDYELTVLRGTKTAKRKQLASLRPGSALQVVAVNYESARVLEQELRIFSADLIIADEGHKLKDPRSAQSRTMYSLAGRSIYRLLLTGTLITNHQIDVFGPYRFLNPSVFGTSFYTFRNRYFRMTGYGGHTPVFLWYMREEFLSRLHSIAFRVTKAECLDLPPITEEERLVCLEPAAMRLYTELEESSVSELQEAGVNIPNVLTKLLRLCQFTGGHLPVEVEDMKSPLPVRVSSAKLNALSDIIDSATEDGEKLVIMARFVPELNDIEALLVKKKISYAVVRGGTPDHDGQVRRFQEDPGCRVFLGQIAAAGLGITLTAASTMVFYSLDFSMANFDQARARIHRSGQTWNCHYIYLICAGTVDRKVIRALRSKMDLARILIDEYRAGKNPFRDGDTSTGNVLPDRSTENKNH